MNTGILRLKAATISLAAALLLRTLAVAAPLDESSPMDPTIDWDNLPKPSGLADADNLWFQCYSVAKDPNKYPFTCEQMCQRQWDASWCTLTVDLMPCQQPYGMNMIIWDNECNKNTARMKTVPKDETLFDIDLWDENSKVSFDTVNQVFNFGDAKKVSYTMYVEDFGGDDGDPDSAGPVMPTPSGWNQYSNDCMGGKTYSVTFKCK
ncbi:MAG: hypothetical protein Q9227_003068 [Pyrenula ochraceoflavens]